MNTVIGIRIVGLLAVPVLAAGGLVGAGAPADATGNGQVAVLIVEVQPRRWCYCEAGRERGRAETGNIPGLRPSFTRHCVKSVSAARALVVGADAAVVVGVAEVLVLVELRGVLDLFLGP